MGRMDLFDYQRDAVEKLRTGCILCGGVGSGKSRTSIAYYFKVNGGDLDNDESTMKDPMDLYIITTARKRDTLEWDGELAMFMMSKLPNINYYNNKIVIDSWNNLHKYIDVRDSFFIFDEQRVVGSGAWVKAFLKITKANQWILLSATPGDTWMDYVPVFIANGFYRNRTEFIQNHVIYRRFSKYPQVDRYVGVKYLIRLRDRILIDMPFERKTMPHHEDIILDYDRDLYKQILKNRWDIWKDQPIDSASELCYALRKVVNSDESRQTMLLELADRHPRIIVFYNFNYERDILREIFKCNGFDIAEWNGFVHQPIPTCQDWIYLVQYNAGAEGWNCIKTDTVVFYSQTYSYKTVTQASGRIDRLNTPYTDLYYYHFKSMAPIDIAIARALKEKRNFNESNFVGGLYE